MLFTTPDLGKYISGAILYEETLYQKHVDGDSMIDKLTKQGIIPGIKVDTGLKPLGWCVGTRNILFWFRWIELRELPIITFKVRGLLSGEQFYKSQRVVGIAIFLVAHLILRYRRMRGV